MMRFSTVADLCVAAISMSRDRNWHENARHLCDSWAFVFSSIRAVIVSIGGSKNSDLFQKEEMPESVSDNYSVHIEDRSINYGSYKMVSCCHIFLNAKIQDIYFVRTLIL